MSTPKLIDSTPFHPMVIKVHYDGFDLEVLKPVCEEMISGAKYAVPLEKGGGRSSVYNHHNQPHENKAFNDFYKFLHPITKHIIFNEWKLAKIFEYRISNSWVNVHKRHGLTSEHNHAASVLVCATYLNLPENGGFIQFKDPLEYHKLFHQREDLNDCHWFTVPAKTGDVLIFPGWLNHRTQPSNTDEERWVLTTNFVNMNRPPNTTY
jgi:hypothetical protein